MLKRELLELIVVHLVPAAQVGGGVEGGHGRDGEACWEHDGDEERNELHSG